jgi:hypothetical protein
MTALAPRASTASYKRGEDCQFCAPIPDRHKLFCTGALSVPYAGADTMPGMFGDESGRYRFIKVMIRGTVDTVTVAFRAPALSSSKYQINAVKWLAQEGRSLPFQNKISRLTSKHPCSFLQSDVGTYKQVSSIMLCLHLCLRREERILTQGSGCLRQQVVCATRSIDQLTRSQLNAYG